MKASLVAAIGLALLFASGASAEEWFDAYARGLGALEQGQGGKAAEWLERAARKRPEPATNVLTYGTNRLDRYHPYLRLAEAYLLAGRPDAAQEALQRSAAKGKEPAADRERLAARVKVELEKQRVAAATAMPTAVPTAAVTAPPTPVPSIAAAASPSPRAAVPTEAPRIARTETGTLEIESNPAGATVLLGARLVGTTPLVIEVLAGAYDVTLRKEGAADVRFPVQVQAGRRARETRDLMIAAATPAPTAVVAETAALVIVTDPPGVAVYVDDVPLGTSDPRSGRIVKSGLEPGAHRLRLSRLGFEDLVEDVSLTAGSPTTVKRALVEEKGPFTPAVLGMALALALAVGIGLILWRRRGSVAPSPLETTGSRPTVTPSHTMTSPPTIASPGVGPPTLDTHAITFTGLSAPRTGDTAVSAAQAEFGEYRLLAPLGKGGMAAVFKAERRGQVCALKRPLSAFLEDPELLERFQREAEIGRTLHHHNIIRIFDRGSVGNVPYFTMELVDGETLQAHLQRVGALDGRAATAIAAQVAEALDYAHLKGVVHRDLKPSNIMILRDGAVKVMDYGIARARRFEGLTVTGVFLGTPDYAAPETAMEKGSDARSDLYSLGVIYYEMLAGHRPFVADTPFATLMKHCNEPPPPFSSGSAAVPPELEAIVRRLLSKSADDRYPGAEELLIALRDFLNRAA